LPRGLPLEQIRSIGREAKLAQREDLAAPHLADLARLDDAAFRARFAGTPIKRTGRDRFIRNVLVAIGNSGEAALAEEAVRLLDDPSPLVRAMAVWAASRLVPPARMHSLAEGRLAAETDADVEAEWKQALQPAEAAA
jgi:epoxyqueuosine reductase